LGSESESGLGGQASIPHDGLTQKTRCPSARCVVSQGDGGAAILFGAHSNPTRSGAGGGASDRIPYRIGPEGGGFPTAPRLDLNPHTGGALGLGYPSGPSQPRPETKDGDGERVVGMGTSWGQGARRRLRARGPFSPGSTSNGPGPAWGAGFRDFVGYWRMSMPWKSQVGGWECEI